MTTYSTTYNFYHAHIDALSINPDDGNHLVRDGKCGAYGQCKLCVIVAHLQEEVDRLKNDCITG